MLPNVGVGELAVIVLVALIVFGPKRLPEMMRSAGKAFRSFQTESQRAMSELREAVDITELSKEISESVVFDTPDEQAVANQQAAAKTAAAPPARKQPAKKKTTATAKKKTTAKKTTATAKKKIVTAKKKAVKKLAYPTTEDT